MMRWLLTYADLITLLMAFFVIMYAMSRVNTARFAELSHSLKVAFNGRPSVVKLGTAPPSNLVKPPITPPPTPALVQLYEEIQALIKSQGLSGQVSVQMNSAGVTISLLEDTLFDLGSATIKPSSTPVLLKVAVLLSHVPNAIEVQGYTDNLPIHTRQFPSNWELSAARALHVLEFLNAPGGIAPQRLRATAYGQYHPFASNATSAGRQENRRVEIVVLSGKSP